MLNIYPAVDIKGGRAVRLLRGEMSAETVYGDPVEMAQRWQDEGASWLHVVDLDGAVGGRPANLAAIATVLGVVRIPVQLGGGLREVDAIEAAIGAGCERVVVGSAAIEDPDAVRGAARRWPGRIVLGLDLRGREVSTRGWTGRTGRDFADVIAEFEGVEFASLITTDISRDGAMSGPGLESLGAVLGESPWPVIASGGISSVADVESVASLDVAGKRVEGAIVGRALYEGAVTLGQLLDAASDA